MICPTEGRLRAAVDHPNRQIAEHARDCEVCGPLADRLAADATAAAAAVAALDRPSDRIDLDAALDAVVAEPETATIKRSRWSRLPMPVAAAVVALLVMALVVGTPTGREAAADFLAGFRAERLQAVTIDATQPTENFESLDDIAAVDVDDSAGEPASVTDRAAAADVVGFMPAQVTTLPDGAREGETMASPPTTARLTFDAGVSPDLPDALDGATLIVSLPGAVVTEYEVDGGMLVVGEAGQLAAEARGADLADIRSYLLSRREVPQDLARQLSDIDDWTTTLPVPLPVDDVTWDDTTVAGSPGLVLDDGVAAGLLWTDGGRITAIGGPGADIDELRDIADGLRR